ncbi:DUF192 domain-containing protein [Mesorhizobium sp. KR9-304]|uniref:DUF192 domain-containing protein n=1 Tax=Mesorhizobium sp. KR9-304 TaxID=3156614 RepID=UPI0032B5905E
MIRKSLLAVVAVVAIVAALGFYIGMPQSSADQAMRLPVDAAPLVAETAGGERSFTIEIADDGSERSAGLMFRQTMDDDHGMLFVFSETKEVGFWMKNTPMPLDLIFIGEDGRVRGILPGEPFSEAPISPGEPVRFVLELKRGTAEKAGIKDGDILRHPTIAAAAGRQ